MMDSNQEESLDILKLQGILFTDGISQSQNLKQCQNPPSSRPSSQALELGDEGFNKEINQSSMASAESNHYLREPLIPTDPMEPPPPDQQQQQLQHRQEQQTLRGSSPPPLPFQMMKPNYLHSHNNTTYTAHTYTDTGVDRTGTLTLDYSASQDGYDIEETQRDPDSYTERMQYRMEHESHEHHIVFDNNYNEDADTQPIDDDDDGGDGEDTQNLNNPVVLFDETKRFAPTPKPNKRKRNGSPGKGGAEEDDEEDLPLAGLGENDAPFGLTQLFQASSPVRRPVSSKTNTSPAVMFANNAGMPMFANRNNKAVNESPSLGLRKVITEAAAEDYVSLQESQERRNGRKKASPKQNDDDDDDDGQDPLQARWERERRERNRIKSVEAQLKNVTAKPRANAVRYGRKPKDKTKSSPQTSSPTTMKGKHTKDINKEADAIVDLAMEDNEDVEMQEESTEDIRHLEEPTQEDSLRDGEIDEDDEIQVPSTAKKSSKRSPKGAPEDTPVRAPRGNIVADDDAEVFVSNSQDDDNRISQRSAISDSQPNGLKEPLTSSLRTASQKRLNDTTPKTIHDFSAGAREQIVAMVGPLTSSVPRGSDREALHPQSIVPESSSPPRAPVKDRDAPPSSPPVPVSGRSTRRTVFESRHVERRGTEPITETPRVLRGGKTFSVPPTSQGAKGSSALDTVRTPYPEKGIPAIQPTTIPETSPYRGQDNSPAPFRPAASNVLRSKRIVKDTSVEIPCSLSEDNGASKTNSKTKSKAQAPDSPKAPVANGAKLFTQAKKRSADAMTDFGIPVPKKRFRRQRRSSGHVVQDSYDISSHQLCTSSENGFSSPPPSIIDEEARQLEDQTPASPPISSPLPSTDKIIPRSSVANRSIVKESSLNDDAREIRTTPRKKTSKSKFRGPGKRVFAQFKGGNNCFYPATVVVDAVIAVATEIGVRFDDGTSCTVSKLKVKRLDLRKDDIVKVDRPGLKTKNWIVEGVKTSADKPEYTDIHGNDIVILKQKQTGKNAGKDAEVIEVPITQLYLTSTHWAQFQDRYVPYDEAGPETSPAVSRSPSSTPKVQLRTPPTVNYTSDVASVSATAGPMTSGGLFSGMLFAISYGDKDTEKKALIHKIEHNGGKIVNNGFADLFTQPAKSGKYDVALLDGVERWGFACVIADKHSRTLKYLQALALGLPCIAGRWVDVCVKKKTVIPWEDYLLPAGESSHLNNAVKSRVLQPVPAKEARFVEMFQDRKKLFDGYNVIFVMGGGKVEEKRKPHLFLVHALGATSVERIASLDAACKHIAKVKSTPLSTKYIIITKNTPRDLPEPVKKKKAILLDDEWFIQSLIMGRLLDPED